MIQHVTREISRSQLENCVSFYAMLGFEQVDAPASVAGRAVWLERSATQIHLMPTAKGTDQGGHVGIVVEGYEETVTRLGDAGFEVEPRREHWGSPRAYVRDPAGNLVELMAWPPGGQSTG